MAVSQYSLTILDNSNEDPGSKTQFRVVALTSSNFVVWNGLLDDLQAAIAGITMGTPATARRLSDNVFISRVRPSSLEAQREKKWLVVYEDMTTHRLYHNEIATADLSLLTSGSDKITDFGTTGPLFNFLGAFEAAVLSPAGNVVELRSLEYVGKRL